MWEFNMGAVIQQKRKEKELTQEELARLMGVSKSSVSKWETGQTYPDIYL
jgi:transcriptional regulator with XRE-family HTH domain